MFREGQNHAFLFFIVYKHYLNLCNIPGIKDQMQVKAL